MNNGDMPAMPVALAAPTNDGYLSTDGLSKRELFAMAAMQGYIARGNAFTPGSDAVFACQLADALLAELSKEPQA